VLNGDGPACVCAGPVVGVVLKQFRLRSVAEPELF